MKFVPFVVAKSCHSWLQCRYSQDRAVDRGDLPIYEPELADLLAEANGRMRFVSDYGAAGMDRAEGVFITVFYLAVRLRIAAWPSTSLTRQPGLQTHPFAGCGLRESLAPIRLL